MPVIFIAVIAAVSGMACLSLLLVAFCLLKQWRKDVKHLDDELGSLEDRLSPVKRIRSNPQIQRHLSRKGKGIKTLPPSIPPIVYGPTNRLDSTGLLEKSFLKPPLLSLPRPNDSLSIPSHPSVSRATIVTGCSERTVSIYSAESAPLHFHDQLSNPLFINRVIMSNITRANLPQGMNLPSSVTRDIGLFITPSPNAGTVRLPSDSNSIRLRDAVYRTSTKIRNSPESSHSRSTPVSHSARFRTMKLGPPNQTQPLFSGVIRQPLRKTASTSSFPPPLW